MRPASFFRPFVSLLTAAVTAAARGATPSTLGLTRKRGGVRLDLTLSSALKAYASYALEKRQGARPFAAVWGNNGGNCLCGGG